MIIDDLLIEARLKRARRKQEEKKIENLLLTASDPIKIIDKLTPIELTKLSKKVLKRKIPGYKNLYEYILNNFEYNIYPKESDCKDLELGQTLLETRGYVKDEFITDELLLSKSQNEETILDIMLKDQSRFFTIPQVTTVELAKELISRERYDLLINASLEVLKYEIAPNTPIIKVMLDNHVIPNVSYVTQNECTDFPLVINPSKNILFENINNDKKVIDYLLESSENIKFNVDYMPEEMWKNVINACIKHEKCNAISSGPERFYTQVIDESNFKESLFKHMYNLGLEPEITGKITNHEIIQTYLLDRKNNYMLVSKCPSDVLTTPFAYGKYTPIECIILNEKNEILKDKDNYSRNFDQNNLKSVVNMLYHTQKFNDKMAIEFAKYRYFLSPIDNKKTIGLDQDDEMQKYIFHENYIPTTKHYEEFANMFKYHFREEDNDQEIIENIISLFNSNVFFDEKASVRDLQALIDYKKKHHNFRIIYNEKEGSSFLACKTDLSKGHISLENKYDKYALAHEWGHLIHEVYLDGKTPESIKKLIPYDYGYMVDNFRSLFELYSTIEQEAENLLDIDSIKEEFINYINDKKGSLEKYKEEIRREYKVLIGTDKLLIETLKSPDMSFEVKKAITEAIYASSKDEYLTEKRIEEYVNERIKAEFEDFKKVSYIEKNAEFLCYENFIDAYYGGTFGDVSDVKNTKVPTCTHDTLYFMRDKDNQFSEMFANYVELRKIRTDNKYIEKLKEKTSPELIEAIEKLYENLSLDYTDKLENSGVNSPKKK